MTGDYLASCDGKQRFATYDEAKTGAESLGSKASAYKCRYGNHYHRGHRKDSR